MGGILQKAITALALVALLAGCSVESATLGELEPSLEVDSEVSGVVDEQQNEPSRTIYEIGCDRLASGELTNMHLETYRPIVEDICQEFTLNEELVEVILSPNVNREAADFYLKNNVFGLSYWDRYLENGLPVTKIVLMMEDEQEWWRNQLDGLLVIEPEWFGPTDGGGHCYAAVAEAFCPKAYFGYEGSTAGDFNVLTTMLGSSLDWDAFRKVVPIHESTHQFHVASGLGHWRYWFVEGQATYFELAASVLIEDLGVGSWRDELANQSPGRDNPRFTATTREEVAEYMRVCDGGGQCDGFRYFGASLAHELLVKTFGMDAYFEWNLALASDLPDFDWNGMPESVRNEGAAGFARLFEEHFGIELAKWEQSDYADYLLENYN